MGRRQLNDDGAVIGYQPKLYYDKARESHADVKTQKESKRSSASRVIENHTKCFIGFANNTPSKAIDILNFAINNMKKLIGNLAKSFQGSNLNKYNNISLLVSAIENDDLDYITEFVDYHRYNIEGDIAPELMETIYKTQQRLEILKSTIKEIYYGDANIDEEKCHEIDNAYVNQVRQYENTGEFHKINYAAISYDSTLNRSVSTYAFSANKQCILLADIVNKTDSKVSNEAMISMVKKLFEETNCDIKSRNEAYDLQQDVEIVQKTLYNYYNKRQELINLYDLLGNSDSIYLSRKISKYQESVDEAIANVNKTFIGSQSYLSELGKIETEKHFLLSIYSDLSNKS